jgi:hypothetical protein
MTWILDTAGPSRWGSHYILDAHDYDDPIGVDVCMECGALVESLYRTLHEKWHERLTVRTVDVRPV